MQARLSGPRSPSARRLLPIAAPLIVGLVVMVCMWQWQRAQARSVKAWRARAGRCATAAESIAALRQQPRSVEDRVVDSHTLAGYLERAAMRVGVAQNRIRSIRPEYPRRLKSSPYVETVTRVRLTKVSMAETAKLIWNLQKEAPGVVIPEVHVWAESETSADWEAELMVVALAYSPA